MATAPSRNAGGFNPALVQAAKEEKAKRRTTISRTNKISRVRRRDSN